MSYVICIYIYIYQLHSRVIAYLYSYDIRLYNAYICIYNYMYTRKSYMHAYMNYDLLRFEHSVYSNVL